MTRFGDWFGKIDDKSIIYRSNSPQARLPVREWLVAGIVGSSLTVGLLFLAIKVLGQLGGDIACGMIVAIYLVVYAIWRRRRNSRLSGSPTRLPHSGPH